MTRSFKIGDRVRFSGDACDNYGTQYADKIFIVEQWFDHYVKPADMIGDIHGHPGFDDVGSCLYHLTGLSFDVYDWELKHA